MNSIHQASIKYLTYWIQNKRQVDNKQDTHTKPTYRREALLPLSATTFSGTKHHNHFSLPFWEDEKYSQENQIILELHKIMSLCIDKWNYYNMVVRAISMDWFIYDPDTLGSSPTKECGIIGTFGQELVVLETPPFMFGKLLVHAWR